MGKTWNVAFGHKIKWNTSGYFCCTTQRGL